MLDVVREEQSMRREACNSKGRLRQITKPIGSEIHRL
jgi:hypothetical protein